MHTPEQIAAKRAAAATLLDIHPDRLTVCHVTGDLFLDDQPSPMRKKHFAVLALKAMIIEWLGWGDNDGVTAELAQHHKTATRTIIERDDLIGAAGLALHLRES